MVTYKVYFKDGKVGTLLTDDPRHDRFLPNEAIEKSANEDF